jgi:thiamine-phosphate pyrophosphorylase
MPEIEIKRSGIDDIFVANIERSKESLRVLEEFFKLIDMRVSAGFSRLRFDAYGIEKRALKKIEVFMSKSQHARSGQ